MITDASLQAFEQERTEDSDLLACMRKIGKGLIASGVSVGVVENTLTEIAIAYDTECEIVALPNEVWLQLSHSSRGRIEFAVQRLTLLQLDQVSELAELIDQVKSKKIPLDQANQSLERILTKPPRFKPAIVILGYFLSCVGLTMLFRPDPRSLLITGSMGILVGLMLWGFQKQPRFNILLPVIVSTVVSTLIFNLTRQGFIYGPANLLVAPLVIFLPGSLLTTGMIELASMHILSGSARLIYGGAMLALLFVGITVGLNLSNLPSYQVYAYEAVSFPWWAPYLGTLLFGLGTYVRLSGANRDLFWMLVVLYIAMLAQAFGEQNFNSYIGAFLGAIMMTLSSEFIARSPKRTPAVASQMLAFWFLVPGSRGLLSVTSLLTANYQSAAVGLGQMAMLILAITLGVLLGTLLVSPQKFVPVSSGVNGLRRI